MPRTQTEDDKKHGDKLQPLIDRTAGGSSQDERSEAADESDATELQDDVDEDVQNDDVDDRRDVGEQD